MNQEERQSKLAEMIADKAARRYKGEQRDGGSMTWTGPSEQVFQTMILNWMKEPGDTVTLTIEGAVITIERTE